MSAAQPPQVSTGLLKGPAGAGLGFVPNEDYLRSQLMGGEPFWS
jgi:hypothetical protein